MKQLRCLQSHPGRGRFFPIRGVPSLFQALSLTDQTQVPEQLRRDHVDAASAYGGRAVWQFDLAGAENLAFVLLRDARFERQSLMEGKRLVIIDFQIDRRHFQPGRPNHQSHGFIKDCRGCAAMRVPGRALLCVIQRELRRHHAIAVHPERYANTVRVFRAAHKTPAVFGKFLFAHDLIVIWIAGLSPLELEKQFRVGAREIISIRGRLFEKTFDRDI